MINGIHVKDTPELRAALEKARKEIMTIAFSCSFCGKSCNECEIIIAGPTVNICNECIEAAQQCVDDIRNKDKKVYYQQQEIQCYDSGCAPVLFDNHYPELGLSCPELVFTQCLNKIINQPQ